MDTITIGINIINGLIPFAFSYVLYDTYKEKKRRFYLYWFIGFHSYGMSNIVNAYMRLIGTETPTLIALIGIFAFIAFTGLLVGVGELTHQKKFYMSLSLCVPIITIILYLAGAPVTAFTVFFMLPYMLITVVLVVIMIRYKLSMTGLLVGWAFILLANIGIAVDVLNIVSSPIIALIGKGFIFFWMTQPYFSTFAEGFEEFISEPAEVQLPQVERYITMVETSSSADTLGWINKQIVSGEEVGLRSILFLIEDNEKHDLSELESLENLYLFKVIEGYHKSEEVFSKRVMEVSNDVSDISVLIYDLLEHIRVNNVPAQLFFYDVSLFIKRNEWKRVYSQMISLIPQFKADNLFVNFIYNKDNLENRYIVEIIRHLADNVVQLED